MDEISGKKVLVPWEQRRIEPKEAIGKSFVSS